MHLALVIDDYLPKSTRVGAKMFHELACELKSMGHIITVITPDDTQNTRLSFDTLDGINIWRFKNGKLKDVNKIIRAINESLLSFNAWSAIKKNVSNNTFDAVIYYSPSIFWGSLINKIKKKCNCKSYLILRDLFPQWIIDAKLIKDKSLIARYFRFFEQYSYRQADTIGLMSRKNIDVFINTSAENKSYCLEVLRNWAKLYPFEKGSHYRNILGLEDKVIYFYGGNIGHAQDMANLMRLVKNMQSYENAHFLFVGQGDEVNLINSLAEQWQLRNFTFLSSVSQIEFKKLLSEVDIGLFSLAKNHSAHNFPGKLLGYMVQSLPILGSVNNDNDLIPIINKSHAGFIHVNGNDDELLRSAISLYESKELRHTLGKNASTLLLKEFDVSSAAKCILNALEIN
ncbi:glycosyltransferase family 4 protein [Morganella morganii]|uniref:glycosyltransferase family 4 protein n=1 Tax=Morganella morganii TaxID=582 RepID=UPI0021CE10B6|nr:glycosyltransferase family 4 protein [Morganella morganii]MCU6274654.1 glycosyltransferase family 4 protein [Morganella morganii]